LKTLLNRKYIIIIPVYNEGKHIDELVKQLLKYTVHNICFINDASTDTTESLIKKHNVILINHKNNSGKGSALQTGFKYAIDNNYDGVFMMDGDLQHLPQEIVNFEKKIQFSNPDIIIGTRDFNIKNMPFHRYLSNKLTSLVASILSKVRIIDSQSGYRFISTKVLKNVKLKTNNFQTETEILIKAALKKFKISNVDISTVYGDEESHINPIVDTLRFLKLICFFIKES